MSANAGGVICGAAECRGAGHAEAFAEINEKVTDTTAELLERSKGSDVRPALLPTRWRPRASARRPACGASF
jgi:hypothetical protein